MFNFLRVFVFCLFSFATFAQNPSLNIIRVNAENYCLGTELTIDVNVNGTFPASNKFTVIAYRNWNNPDERWSYPAELRGDKLVTVLKEPSLANSQIFGIKVLTSNPQSEIDGNYGARVFAKGSVQLATRWGFTADTVNSTDQITMSLITNPSMPGKVTLNTGETFDLAYVWDWTMPYATVITLPRAKAGTYSIKEASNACGPMNTSGQVNVKVNSIDFIPTAISPKDPCIGQEIKVLFSTDGAQFNPNTKFKIRFASDNSYLDSYKYVDTPATLTGKNELTARVPEGSLSNYDIYLGIVTENPAGVSVNKALKVSLNPRPSFSLKSADTSIGFGESTSLYSNPTGKYPFKITLNTGEVMEYSLNVSPLQTTYYQVKTFESGCGVIENPPNTPAIVVVTHGLKLTEPPYINSRQRIFCEGQTVRLGFKSNGTTPQTTYSLETANASGKIRFPAKLVGDSLEFVIPKNLSQDPALDYGDSWGVRVVSANPTLESQYVNLKIQSPPVMVLAPNSQQSVQYPSAVRLDFDLRGGPPYTAELVNGSKEIFDYRNVWFEQFVKRDTTFKLARLSNACFTDNNPPAFPVKVVNPAGTTPNVFARLISREKYCMGDSVAVEIGFSGKFEAGNEFTISYLRDAQIATYAIRNVTRPGIYKVLLPIRADEGYTASLELSSSLPRLTSETQRFDLGIPLRRPSISPSNNKDNPATMYLGESPTMTVYMSTYSPFVYSLDGVDYRMTSDNNGMARVPLNLENGKVSEFKLKSVTSICGDWNGEVTSYISGIGYKIISDATSNVWRCAGSDAELGFSFESGIPKPGTKFTLQISKSGDQGSFTDIASVTDSRVFKFVTPNVPAGGYYTRIYSSDNISSQSNYLLLIGQAPTAKLTVGYPDQGASSAAVDYGGQVYLTTELTGNSPFGILYSDGEQQRTTNDNYSTYTPTINSPQTFSISKVWNSCGYGTASGTVNVTVNPVLELKKYPESADQAICPGQKVELDYAVKGAALPANTYLVFSIANEKGTIIKLDSVNRAAGRIQLTIPGNMEGKQFYVNAESASLKLSKSILYLPYMTPDMTLIGDNTITAGETTTLYVRANNTFAPNTAFQLSDGQTYTHRLTFPGGIEEIKVSPTVTTTYTLKPLQGACGSARMSGSAVVTVQPKLSQWLSVQRVEGLKESSVCNADTIRVDFLFFGYQGNTVDFEVLLSDSTGNNLAAIPTIGQFSPVLAVIPADVKQSGFYRLRINAKDPKVSGSTYDKNLAIGVHARAKVLTPTVAYQPGQPVNVIVGLTGGSPYYYQFGDENFVQYKTAVRSPDTIRIMPVTPVAAYKISQLSNVCGAGIIDDPATFKIELVTATEPVGEHITFRPNPTASTLSVQFESAAIRSIGLLNSAGQTVFSRKYTGKDAYVDLSAFPAGIYILQVRKKQAVATYRILKY